MSDGSWYDAAACADPYLVWFRGIGWQDINLYQKVGGKGRPSDGVVSPADVDVYASPYGLSNPPMGHGCSKSGGGRGHVRKVCAAMTPQGLEMCAVCSDVAAYGSCSVLDAGPPATVLCSVNVCPE
jgi:hypothetical protein